MADAYRRHGALRERLHFQRRSSQTDGWGNTIPGAGPFETVFTVSASMTPRTGGEEVTAARLGGRQPYIVRVRKMPAMNDVTVSWRIADARNAGRLFNIASPLSDPDGKNQWLEFLAIEGVPS